MKIGLIVNPIAGGGIAINSLDDIKHNLGDVDEITVTGKPGEAMEISKRFVDSNFDFVVVAGGDGTLNEVSQGLIGTETVLVPLALGNGSDFTRTTGRIQANAVMKALKEKNVRAIDTAQVESNGKKCYFINIMEIGFGASVMKRFNARRKPAGSTSFTRQILMEAFKLKSYRTEMTIDESEFTCSITEAVIANGRYFGRGLLASPDSVIDDGLLDIHIIGSMGKGKFLMKLGKIRDGSYTSEKEVRNFRCSSFKMRTPGIPLEVDGEFIGHSPLEVNIVPKSLKVLFPNRDDGETGS